MSLRLAAPSLYGREFPETISKSDRYSSPFENGVVFQEFIEIKHQLVDGFSHMEMPHGSPDSIGIGKDCDFILISAQRRLELISV